MTLSEIFKRFLQLFILGVLVYFAWIIYRDSRETPDIDSSEPQLILNDYKIIRYNETGILEFILIGDTLVHHDDGSDLTDPNLVHYIPKEDGSLEIEWEADSLFATISQDQNLITLRENVILYKPDIIEPNNALTLTTELLYIYDQGEKVDTDLFVTISTPTRTLTGIGLEGYPHKEQFSLLEDVRSSFIINQDTAHE